MYFLNRDVCFCGKAKIFGFHIYDDQHLMEKGNMALIEIEKIIKNMTSQ